MAYLVEVDDPTDARLADYVHLRDVSLRKSLEAEHGLFIAEGEKVVRRAVEAGHHVRSLLMSPRWVSGLADVLARTGDVPCYVVPEDVVEKVTGFHVHRGALASMHRQPLPDVEDVLSTSRTVVVLEDIVDHTNVGAIFRTAAALGVDAVVLSPRCADPLYRRSVKVAMGAVFAVPYAKLPPREGPSALSARGFRTVALTPAEGSVPVEEAFQSRRVALLLGSEGHGLSHHWLEEADVHARIPMAAGVDSLNVAAAAAVACYVLASRPTGRRRRA